MSDKNKGGRPRKATTTEVVRYWKGMRIENPKFSKRLLAKYFEIDRSTACRILKEAVKSGELPEDTFASFPPKRGK